MKTTAKRFFALVLSALLLSGGLTACSEKLSDEKEPESGEMEDLGGETEKHAGEDFLGYAAANLEYPTCDPIGEDNAPMSEDFVYAAANFGLDMLRLQKRGENTMISPVSLLYALGMTANGASGNTLSQMEDVLYGGIPADVANTYFLDFTKKLPDSAGGVSLDIANSIWMNSANEGFIVRDSFLDTNRAYYGAGVFGRDFSLPATVDEVNAWVSDNTDGMIPAVISELKREDLMLLVNTVLFDGKWKETYEDRKIITWNFAAYDGSFSEVEMLHSAESMHFSLGEGKGFVRPYAERYSFVGILPDEGVDVYDYAASLTGRDLVDAVTGAMENPPEKEALVRIPEFSFDYDTEATDVLISLGMTDAFSASADFRRLGQADGGMCIGSVIHKTRIELTRSGTKAAAATVVNVTATGAPIEYEPPIEIYLDRPFVFAIVDNETGLPLFCGIVTEID